MNRPLLRHVAVQVEDPEATAAFYCDFLGLTLVGRSSNPVAGDMIFLSGDRSEEDHELQLISRAAAEHVAFRVESLSALKSLYAQARAKGIPIALTGNHGTSVSFFVREPGGKLAEVYWPTGRTDVEPSMTPIDLDLSEDELMAQVAATRLTETVRQPPSSVP